MSGNSKVAITATRVELPATAKIARGAVAAQSPTYSKRMTAPQTPVAVQTNTEAWASDNVRELKQLADHPKMRLASRTFLEIAHYDSGAQLIDVYA